MITFEYRFDILPGKQAEYQRYVKGPGKSIWEKQKGVKAVRKFRSMLGGETPQRVVQVDIESLAVLEKILADPNFRKARDRFHDLVCNVTDSLLTAI
ncbi:MAG: hypothetical protein H6Q84_1073 [Deltaproteobacteria bacterium]|nr:hypothetical protein [Deltaproteobacteria bacterium]